MKIFILYMMVMFLISIVVFNLTYFIFGYFNIIRARKVTDAETKDIEKGGISHYTSQKGYDGINRQCYLKGSKFLTAYSNHFRKCVYFFANEYIDEKSFKFNNNTKYIWKIDITNLTEKQLNVFMIRNHDRALIYPQNFIIENDNIVKWTRIGDEITLLQKIKFYLKGLLKIKLDIYTGYLYLSMLLAFIIVGILSLLIYIII